MKHIFAKGALLLVAIAAGIMLSASAYSAKSFNKNVQLIAGRADTVQLSSPVVDVLVANPTVADVGTLRSNRLYIVGKTVGDTNVLAYDEAGNEIGNIAVHVRLDDRNMQETLREFFPDEKISARTVKDNIILSGTVSSPAVSAQVRDLAARFMTGGQGQTIVDLMKVRGEQQVMLKVKVIEAKRSILKELGVETDFRVPNAARGASFNGGDVGRTSSTPFGTGTLILGKRFGNLTERLRALETNGLVNTLAEPNLTAISGETAGFLAGGEYPVPTGRDSQGNVTIEFKQFGVSLNFTPTVMSKERIALHMSTEVSEKDSSNRVQLVDTQIDGLSVRRAETTVEMGSGGTLMIAGLIKSDTLHSLNGLPGAQELPILGQLFKSRSFTRNESELLIIVTPYLVDPYSDPEAVAETTSPAPRPVHVEPLSDKPIIDAPAPVPEKTGALTPILPPASSSNPPVETSGNALSQRFVENLRKTYGNKVPEKVGTGAHLGYIVE